MVVLLLLSRLCVRTKLCLAHNKRGVLSYVCLRFFGVGDG